MGADIPDSFPLVPIHVPRSPHRQQGRSPGNSSRNPKSAISPRSSKLLSSLGTSAGLPSKILVPHHSRRPSGSPLLPRVFRRFLGFLLLLLLAAAAASPVCKIRQAPDWLVPGDSEGRDVTRSHPIRRLRRRGQRRTSRRNVFLMGEQLTSSLGQSEDGARVAGWGRKAREDAVLKPGKASLDCNGHYRTLARAGANRGLAPHEDRGIVGKIGHRDHC
jgi:hypothetical protein